MTLASTAGPDQRTAPDTVDPITLSVIHSRLESIVDEMEAHLIRTAFSPVLAEGRDTASGLYHPKTGNVLVQGNLSLPLFVGVMQQAVAGVIEYFPEPEPGDVYLVNDAYYGGTHLMDVKMIAPFFYEGELFGYLGNTGHWVDTGGMMPGGYAADATEVHQEGLQIPPVRVYRAGELNIDVLNLVKRNIRLPRQTMGDFTAQLNALSVGDARLTEMLGQFGMETILFYLEEFRRRCSRQMRDLVETLPDGTYSGQDWLDNDGITDDPILISLDLTVAGDQLVFDFSNSSPSCAGPMNGTLAETVSGCMIALKHVFTQLPLNYGSFENCTFVTPQGSIVNPDYPRPTSGSASEFTQRLMDVVFNCLTQVLPGRVAAGHFSSVNSLSFGGRDPEKGDESYVFYIYLGGGYGAEAHRDGLTYGCSTMSMATTPAIEVLEHRFPVVVEEFSLREESAGQGEFCGGYGANFQVRIDRGTARGTVYGDRSKFPPTGREGGGEGAMSRVTLNIGDATRSPRVGVKESNLLLAPGDRIRVETPGGGGYGPPGRRDVQQVAQDVAHGYYSTDDALSEFGVVLDAAGAVDEAATEARRAQLR